MSTWQNRGGQDEGATYWPEGIKLFLSPCKERKTQSNVSFWVFLRNGDYCAAPNFISNHFTKASEPCKKRKKGKAAPSVVFLVWPLYVIMSRGWLSISGGSLPPTKSRLTECVCLWPSMCKRLKYIHLFQNSVIGTEYQNRPHWPSARHTTRSFYSD